MLLFRTAFRYLLSIGYDTNGDNNINWGILSSDVIWSCISNMYTHIYVYVW